MCELRCDLLAPSTATPTLIQTPTTPTPTSTKRITRACRYQHKCEFFLEIDGAVALQFTAADLCGLTDKGLLHPFVPPFNEFTGQKDHW
jgi:hypothetical protein